MLSNPAAFTLLQMYPAGALITALRPPFGLADSSPPPIIVFVAPAPPSSHAVCPPVVSSKVESLDAAAPKLSEKSDVDGFSTFVMVHTLFSPAASVTLPELSHAPPKVEVNVTPG